MSSKSTVKGNDAPQLSYSKFWSSMRWNRIIACYKQENRIGEMWTGHPPWVIVRATHHLKIHTFENGKWHHQHRRRESLVQINYKTDQLYAFHFEPNSRKDWRLPFASSLTTMMDPLHNFYFRPNSHKDRTLSFSSSLATMMRQLPIFYFGPNSHKDWTLSFIYVFFSVLSIFIDESLN